MSPRYSCWLRKYFCEKRTTRLISPTLRGSSTSVMSVITGEMDSIMTRTPRIVETEVMS